MTARNNAAYYVAELSKDTGFAGATVTIDPKRWSTRRRNIILRALESGVATCGHETAWFIKYLTEAYGSTIETITKWSSHINIENVRQDKVEELLAYTCAWVKIKLASQGTDYSTYHLSNWIEGVNRGMRPSTIPTPDISHSEKQAFIQQYLKADDTQRDVRQQLANSIEKGELLSIYVEAQ